MKNLRTARIAMHLTQEELGNKVNIKKASISKYERGTMQPSQETLVKLADILGVTVDYLLGRPQKDPRDMEDDEFYASLVSYLSIIAMRLMRPAGSLTGLLMMA